MIAQWMIDVQVLLDAQGVGVKLESRDGQQAVLTYRAKAEVCTYTDLMRVIPANVDCVGYQEQDNIDFEGDRIVIAHLRLNADYVHGDNQKTRPRGAEVRTSEVGGMVELAHPKYGW